MLLSSGVSFPHLILKRRPQLGFVTYLLNYPRISILLPDDMLFSLIKKKGKTKNFVICNIVLLSGVAKMCISATQLKLHFGNLHNVDCGQRAVQTWPVSTYKRFTYQVAASPTF
jgi:hypothetical protein